MRRLYPGWQFSLQRHHLRQRAWQEVGSHPAAQQIPALGRAQWRSSETSIELKYKLRGPAEQKSWAILIRRRLTVQEVHGSTTLGQLGSSRARVERRSGKAASISALGCLRVS